jgi:GTP-binding protein HflX
MSRLGGGIGTRGPGESKLESDRRHLQRRITALENELEVVEKNRRTMRASRDRSGITKIAIVGYTNAGKSTLLNKLTNAGILAEDKLFATLDPTTRKYELPGGESVLLTDTVGFIRNLPHHLVKAFRSTLEEAVYADILMILIDASDEEFPTQLEVTQKLLGELGASDKPTLYVFNKCDKGMVCPPSAVINTDEEDFICISAASGDGVEELAAVLENIVHQGTSRATFFIPNSEQGALNRLYSDATIESIDYGPDGVTVIAIVDEKVRGMLRKYDTNPPKKNEED